MASPSDALLWASVPWTPIPSSSSSDGTTPPTIGYLKTSVPYVPSATSLQTVDVWIPSSSSSSSSATTVPDPSALPLPAPPLPNRWIIHIHGGAWRDPRVTSASFTATAQHLLQRQRQRDSSSSGGSEIAGLASLNYNLSPHPEYPASADDPARNARHPSHIADVLRGIAFLQRLAGPGSAGFEFVLSGHSCGATLAFQAVMAPSRWGLDTDTDPSFQIKMPRAVVGLNGLYDLRSFLARPPPGHDAPARVAAFRAFVRGAFGDDEKVWAAVCPVTAEGDWVAEWTAGTAAPARVVLAQSKEDDLVPYCQLEAVRATLLRRKEEGAPLEVVEAHVEGRHNTLWEEGGRLAEILEEAVRKM